ncbi:uncharacterized protein [Chanodichthys erythropterus]|uniref:uncharacterized protein n=1 Tax=Chanodichthys erythropterus TaxID=933992 RepID=UPI00351E8360
MSKIDRELALEALSALTGTTLKPYFGLKGSMNSDPELDIYNFITAAILGQEVLRLLGARSYGQSPLQSVGKEMFVNMDEFFEPRFDCDFTHLSDKSVCMRGNERYKRPCGWYRIALKVLDKYPDGNTWLGTDGWRSHSVAGEWPVSYHGTTVEGATGIVKSHYKAGPRQLYGRGIYSTYDIDQASGYSREFTSQKNGKRYRVIMQNRINPKMRKVCGRPDYWLIEIPEGTSAVKEKEIVEKSIRPYGILIKEV